MDFQIQNGILYVLHNVKVVFEIGIKSISISVFSSGGESTGKGQRCVARRVSALLHERDLSYLERRT